MTSIDHAIAHLAAGHASLVAVAVALLLGLRHATDPDHLAAVSTLIATNPIDGARRAGRLGLAWGVGHATTLAAFGLPVVLARVYLPEPVRRTTELLVGLVIVALALRLLVRWHRRLPAAHSLGRSPREAYAIGLVHGMDGSAGVGLLLLTAVPARAEAAAALAIFACATAASMATLSSAMGLALTRAPVTRRLFSFAPGLGAVTLAFGVWYALAALP